jgi:signal transduction histidine kinase
MRSTKKGLSLTQVQALATSVGLNPSLPCAIFASTGELVGANRRMLTLLDPHIEIPLDAKAIEALWPFHNEESSGVALYRKLVADRRARSRTSLVAEAGLKHFRLFFASSTMPSKGKTQKIGESYRVVVAEMLRTGDLLQDKATRQALFRSISHEVRTSILALKGYLNMFEESSTLAEARKSGLCMAESLKRLERVVRRLDEFRSELEVLDEREGRKVS